MEKTPAELFAQARASLDEVTQIDLSRVKVSHVPTAQILLYQQMLRRRKLEARLLEVQDDLISHLRAHLDRRDGT